MHICRTYTSLGNSADARKPDVSEQEKYLELLLYSSRGSVGCFYNVIISKNIKVCEINFLEMQMSQN